MTCEDCGAPAPEGLCDACTVARVNEAKVAAIKNAGFLTNWALENTHGPGHAMLSLMTAFLIIHRTTRDRAESPIDTWIARADEVFSELATVAAKHGA